jgi:hypothetical protein
MQIRSMILTGFGLAGAMAAPLFVASTCAAQTAASPAPATTATAPKKPSVATPRMIDEAIQRSQARSAKLRDSNVPEQFGSEEPFTYTPGKTF